MKVTPITGKHTTMHSMLAAAMADERAARGMVIYFEEDGTMHFGELGIKRSDVCMSLMYMHMIANDIMSQPD
jgi:predicted secreted protein